MGTFDFIVNSAFCLLAFFTVLHNKSYCPVLIWWIVVDEIVWLHFKREEVIKIDFVLHCCMVLGLVIINLVIGILLCMNLFWLKICNAYLPFGLFFLLKFGVASQRFGWIWKLYFKKNWWQNFNGFLSLAKILENLVEFSYKRMHLLVHIFMLFDASSYLEFCFA